MTKANIGKPPRAMRAELMTKLTATTLQADNMTEVTLKDMSFKVSPDFHHLFKTTASSHRLSMKELLEQAFEAWVAQNGK